MNSEAGIVPPKKDAWPADSVERRKVSDLVPYARNARTHSDEQATLEGDGRTFAELKAERKGAEAA